MPHTRTAKKRLRQNKKRRFRNRVFKSSLRTQMKHVGAAISEHVPLDEIREEYNLAAKKLDQAAAKGIIHKNQAARKKAQLAKAVHKHAQTASESSEE